MRSRYSFFALLVVIIIIYVSGCRRAGAWLVKDDTPAHADAIILLMGGISDRVLQAADLYDEGRADRLIIVEESMGGYKRLEERGVRIESSTKQVRNAAITLGVPPDSIIILPGDAQSTLTEAMVVRDYIAGDDVIDTVIIVTSPTHSRRASMIFRAALHNADRPVFVTSSPSSHLGFDLRHWWREKEGIQAVLSEYLKIASFVLVEKCKI